ncbi:hypothetical protein [Elizabethkingia miricola]|uniref:hypothetical protein n=1 Tax=Elizabethkingia miricola TaxID=172045 RepID=UPI0038921A49
MEIANLILTGLVFPAVYFISKHFASSYFNKKGENLATKEDIAEITKEVKKVESMFNISTSSEIDYNTLRRNAILEFNNSLNSFFVHVIANNQLKYDNNYLEHNNHVILEADKKYTDLQVKYFNLGLFILTIELEKLFQNLSLTIYNYITSIKGYSLEVDHLHEISSEKNDEFYNTANALNEFYFKKNYKIIKKFREERLEIVEFLDKQIRDTFQKEGA